jgi:tetratricopeptide (TPR) repeat protein
MRPSGTPAARQPRHGLAAVLLAAAALVAYANSFDTGFVQDNKYIVVGDPRVQSLTAKNLGLIFSQTAQIVLAPTSLYRPLNTLSYLFNYAILGNGQNPFGYHAVNLLFHIGNAYLVYLLMLALAVEFVPAVLTAAIWALHPICTEAVTNIVGRADEMAAMAVLGSLLLYIRGTTAGERYRWRYLAASSIAFFAGFLSKENAVVAPAIIILYDLTFRFPRKGFPATWMQSAIDFTRRGWWVYAPPLVIVLLIRHAVLAAGPPALLGFIENPIMGAAFFSAKMTAIKVLGKYLWILIWPAALSVDYGYNQIPLVSGFGDGEALAALAAMAVIVAVAVIAFRRKPAVFFLIAASAIAILPVCNLVIPIGSIMGVRFLYLPSVGFAGCLVIGVYALAQRLKWKPRAPAAVLAVIAVLFGIRTIVRNPDWTDDVTLYNNALALSPNSAKVHFAVSAFIGTKQPLSQYIDQAIGEAEAGMAILKDLPDELNEAAVLTEVARTYGSKAEVIDPGSADGARMPSREAQLWYRKALEVLRHAVKADRSLSAAYRDADLARGRTPDEIPVYGYEGLYWYMGKVQLLLGDGPGAVESYLYERKFNPLKIEIYNNLGRAYLAAGRLPQAAMTFLEAQFLQESRQDTPEAIAVYRMLDPAGCSIALRDLHPALNYTCPLVHQQTCGAFADLAKTFEEAHLPVLAQNAMGQSRQRYGCQ